MCPKFVEKCFGRNGFCKIDPRYTTNVLAGEDSNDDDYMPTVKEKEKVQKEKRREIQQKLQDGEYITNAVERSRIFK
jgi:hypothetical protein